MLKIPKDIIFFFKIKTKDSELQIIKNKVYM